MNTHVTQLEQDQNQASATYLKWRYVCVCGAKTPYSLAWTEARTAGYLHREAEKVK